MASHTYLTITGGDMRATPTRDRVYQFIKEFIRAKGYGPLNQNLVDGLGLSIHTVKRHVQGLHLSGDVTLGEHGRQIDVSNDGKECLRCGRELT